MGRKKLIEEAPSKTNSVKKQVKNELANLKELVIRFAKNKSELDNLDKICKKDNAQIKDIMSKQKLDKFEADDYIASYSIQERTSMNEEKALEIAHKYKLKSIVKTKEYIDWDVLEDLIYNGKVKQDALLELNTCKEVKEVQVLKVSVKKEDK